MSDKLVVTLAAEIRIELEAAGKSLMKAVEHAIAAGELLIEAKKQVRHGEWLPWLDENVEISERTAQAYMKLARAPGEIRAALRLLPLRDALAATAARPKRYKAVLRAAARCQRHAVAAPSLLSGTSRAKK
jgi:hypothetical protein